MQQKRNNDLGLEYPIWRFINSTVDYSVITSRNCKTLSEHMQKHNLSNLIIMGIKNAWESPIMPNLKDFSFIKELRIIDTNIMDIDEIHYCHNLNTLMLQNNDNTQIHFSQFPVMTDFTSGNRIQLDAVWDCPTLKSITLVGVNKKYFKEGKALENITQIRIIKSALASLEWMKGAESSLEYLQLSELSKLEKIDNLKAFENLKYLNVFANKLSNFSVMSFFHDLEYCYLSSKNGDFRFDDFTSFKELKDIWLNGNDKAISVTKLVRKHYGLSDL